MVSVILYIRGNPIGGYEITVKSPHTERQTQQKKEKKKGKSESPQYSRRSEKREQKKMIVLADHFETHFVRKYHWVKKKLID